MMMKKQILTFKLRECIDTPIRQKMWRLTREYKVDIKVHIMQNKNNLKMLRILGIERAIVDNLKDEKKFI
jgi:hypothetical protein